MTRWQLAIFSILVLIAGVMIFGAMTRPSIDQRLADANKLLKRGDYSDAELLALQILAKAPDSNAGLIIAARAATGMLHLDDAAKYYDRIDDAGEGELVSIHCEAGELHLQRGSLSRAEDHFRRGLRLDTHSLRANERLAYMLRLTGRYWDARPLELELLRQDQFNIDGLLSLGLSASTAPNETIVEWLKECQEKFPDDPLPLVGLARAAIFKNERQSAMSLLQTAVKLQPELAEAQFQLGRLLADADSGNGIAAWDAGLPTRVDEHPGIWLVRGQWARRMQEPSVAIRCFWEAARRDPNSQTANSELAQLLGEVHASDQAATFREQLRRLNELASVFKAVNFDRQNDTHLRRTTETLSSNDRLLEARAWYRVALRGNPNSSWATEGLQQVQEKLSGTKPESENRELFSQLDFTSYPLPDRDPTTLTAVAAETLSKPLSAVSFVDQAATAGLEFSYFNGGQTDQAILHMYESNGGGVAVLDFDVDGWPDLYLTQGCTWPNPTQSMHRDRLFRNSGAGRFDDVTEQTELGDERFSQGCSAGDFNNDGFPDLYVANIGVNRLYLNNGDGTYTDISSEVDDSAGFWTTSCVIADLNNDAMPDLFDVNYLQGSEVFTRVCRGRSGEPAACTPDLFDAAPDQLYLNSGDGRFLLRTEGSGIDVPNGKGLGIVAADLDGSGGLDLFIANDQVPNFYFINRSDGNGVFFEEQAVTCGLALDGEGRAQACMGIAAGDADGDGLLDLFVTNFYNESNTLYRQYQGGAFVDATHAAGLRDPGFSMLGFGTQFLDADLDGQLDLVVSNGHVSNSSQAGIPYQMRPQFFHNVAGGRFIELLDDTAGEYFGRRLLGRSLVTLDWNCDGRVDFAVSHLDAPFALLTNETRETGHFLSVKLCGVVSSRDAIGTTVRAQVGEHIITRQLTAGDGFQASNQRQIVFGLGKHKQIDHLTVSWPSGLQQAFHQLSADSEIFLIEGRPNAFSR